MKVSIVIVNYNGEMRINESIASCKAEGVDEKDIVIIDNGSDDSSVTMLREQFSEVIILENSCNAGFSRAVNQGIRESQQDLILILNNDARLQAGCIANFIQCAQSFPNAALIGGRLIDAQQSPQNVVAPFPSVWHELLPKFLLKSFLGHDQMGRLADVSHPLVVPTVIGAALMLRKSCLPKLGFMDEDFFFYLEETEWCHRAHVLGFDVVLCPQAVVVHELGGTANQYRAASRIEFHRSRLLYARKVEGSLAWFILSIHYYFSSSINLISNALAMALTFFQVSRLRRKTRMYAVVWLWHFSGRPSGWGLPNKCPQSKND